MSEQRAEGFWWVRVGGGEWEAAELARVPETFINPPAVLLRTRGGWTRPLHPDIEWGPYLGKEPLRVLAREDHGGVEVSMDGGKTWPVWVPAWQVKCDVAMEAKREGKPIGEVLAEEPWSDAAGADAAFAELCTPPPGEAPTARRVQARRSGDVMRVVLRAGGSEHYYEPSEARELWRELGWALDEASRGGKP